MTFSSSSNISFVLLVVIPCDPPDSLLALNPTFSQNQSGVYQQLRPHNCWHCLACNHAQWRRCDGIAKVIAKMGMDDELW